MAIKSIFLSLHVGLVENMFDMFRIDKSQMGHSFTSLPVLHVDSVSPQLISEQLKQSQWQLP